MEIMRVDYDGDIEHYRMTKEERETIEKFINKLDLDSILDEHDIDISFPRMEEILDF